MVGNEESLDAFELHICVKDYCFARDDRLVGVAVMQLKDIMEQVFVVGPLIFMVYNFFSLLPFYVVEHVSHSY